MPSSLHMSSTSIPHRSANRERSAIAHGAWTWAPNGESTQMRQSPISSRNRSTTIVRSSGTVTGGGAACSSR